jgi:NitT/TauT family transport system ATP-binding protein
MEYLRLEHIKKTYLKANGEEYRALEDINFSVEKSQFISIVGPSGCGKTTLLGCISGLRANTYGRTVLDGREISSPPKEMAVIFQEYGRTLLPWRSVIGNVMFGMENRKEIPKASHDALGRSALRDVALSGFESSYPWQLSGGQQQRVAIARGLANGADILLMDEPFASVDAQTKGDLEDLLLDIWARKRQTVLLVTHDIDEAIYLADRVIVLSKPPCRVVKDIKIELDRPRVQIETREHPTFLQYRRQIHEALGLGHRAPAAIAPEQTAQYANAD